MTRHPSWDGARWIFILAEIGAAIVVTVTALA
jgi:hypothetical protein